jgi:hypothetical protein
MPKKDELKKAFGTGLSRSLLMGKSRYDKVMNLLLLLFYFALIFIFFDDASRVCKNSGKDLFAYIFDLPFFLLTILFVALLWTGLDYFSKKDFKKGLILLTVAIAVFAIGVKMLFWAMNLMCASA